MEIYMGIDPLVLLLVIALVGVAIGLAIDIIWTATNSIGYKKFEPVCAALIGLVFLFVGAFISFFFSTNRELEMAHKFETAYAVSVVSGDIPVEANSIEAVSLFTQDGGPKVCLVQTDDVRYTVTCEGKTLEPIN